MLLFSTAGMSNENEYSRDGELGLLFSLLLNVSTVLAVLAPCALGQFREKMNDFWDRSQTPSLTFNHLLLAFIYPT